MVLAIEPVIATLRAAVPFQEVRSSSTATYLEAALSRQELARCQDLLAQHFGEPVKAFGKPAKFDRPTAKVVDGLGGVRKDQCLFLSRLDDRLMAYAALWPWASDPTRVTLKVGVVDGS